MIESRPESRFYRKMNFISIIQKLETKSQIIIIKASMDMGIYYLRLCVHDKK